MSRLNMNEQVKKPKIFHRINKLKRKAGVEPGDEKPGFIDPEAVRKAQVFISDQEKHYPEEVRKLIDMLSNTWNELKIEKNDKRAQTQLSWLYNYANNIKDMAETYGYSLMEHFGKSLRDFCEYIDVKNKAHHVIVEAHINVMRIAYNENIKDYSTPKAEELKQIVARAIEKYS